MVLLGRKVFRGKKIWHCRQCDIKFFSENEDLSGLEQQKVHQYKWHHCGGNRLGIAQLIGVEIDK